MKYAAAGVVIVAGAAAGAYYATRPTGPTTTAATETAPAKINIAYDFAPCEAVFYVAMKKGFFADEGCPSEFGIVPCASAAEMREAIHSGNAIITYSAYEYIPAVDEGADFRYIMGAHTGCHELFVSTRFYDQGITDEKSLAQYLQSEKAAGRKPKVCIGAVGNSPYFFTAFFLENNGMSMDDIEVVSYDWGAILTAMQEGEIDIACEWDTIPRQAENAGIGKIVVDPARDPPYNELYCCFVGMNHTFTQTYPETTMQIVKAFAKAGTFVHNNPQESAEIMRGYGEELCPYTVEDLMACLPHYDYTDAGNLEREKKTLKTYGDATYRAGLIRHDGDWIVENGLMHLYTP